MIGFVFLSFLLIGWGTLLCVLPAVGGAGSWIHVEAFVEVFTNTSWGQEFSGSLVSLTQWSHHRLRPNLLVGKQDLTSHLLCQWRGLKQTQRKQRKNQEAKTEPQKNGKWKIRQIETEPKEHTCTQNQNSPKKTSYIQWAKETKNDINKLKAKLTKTQQKTRPNRVPTDESSKGNKTNKHGEKKRKNRKVKLNRSI